MPINHVLTVIGLPIVGPHNALQAFTHEGLQDARDFAHFNDEEITRMCSSMSRGALNNNGYRIGALHVKKVRALAHWARDLANRQLPVPDNAFTIADMEMHMAALDAEPTGDQEVQRPESLDPEKWDEWEPTFVNYLMSLQSVFLSLHLD